MPVCGVREWGREGRRGQRGGVWSRTLEQIWQGERLIGHVWPKMGIVSVLYAMMIKIQTLSPSLVDPFLPSLPSSPSMPRCRAKAMRSLAGRRTAAGRRWHWRSQIASAHVLRAFGVGSSSARGMARRAVKIERSSRSAVKRLDTEYEEV